MKLRLPLVCVRLLPLAACACVLGWSAAGAQASPTWLPAQALSSPTTAPGGVHPVVTMGPHGDIAAVWIDAGIVVASVRKAGAESSTTEAVSVPGEASREPNVAVNASGEVVVAWFSEETEQYEIAIRKPGGVFSEPIPAGPTGISVAPQPSVAIDSAGDVLVGESRQKGIALEGVYAWRPAGGVFTETILNEPAHEGYAPTVALDEAGDAVVAWEERLGSSVPVIVRAITRPAGGAFGSAQSLSAPSEYAFSISAAIGAAGQAAVVWQHGGVHPPYRIEASTSASPTQPLGPAQVISPAAGSGERPAVGVGAGGQVLAAWAEEGSHDTEDIASGQAGGSFQAAVEASSNGSWGDPRVASDAAGDAVVAWGTEVEGAQSVRAVTYTAGDTGSGTVSPEVTLSTAGERIDFTLSSNVPAAAVGMDSAGDAIVGWERFAEHTILARIYDATGPALKLEAPASAVAGQPVTFKSLASDPFSGVALTTWSFGDGTGTEGTGPTHVYAEPGTYTVTVLAINGVGNVTATSSPIVVSAPAPPPLSACAAAAGQAVRSCPAAARPPACVVPKLRGLSRSAAARRLLAAHCKLGRVAIAKRYRHVKRLVIATQSARIGSRLADGASIAVTLKPPPPQRHKRRHRPRR